MKKPLKALMLAFLLGVSLPVYAAETSDLKTEFNAATPYTDINTLKNGDIVHLRTGTHVTKKQMMNDIDSAQVIYISELHDNFADHKVQLAIIKEFEKRHPGKIVISMEMFQREAQAKLDLLKKGDLSLEDFNKLFDQDWPVWREAYQPILDYIHDKSIPVIALKPTSKQENIIRSAQTDSDLPKMDLDDPYYKAFFKEFYLPMFKEHGGPKMAERVYRMMVFWDEAMAARVAEFLENPENKDKKLIVIAGTGHVGYGFGIPKRAFKRVPHAYSTIIPTTNESPGDALPLLLGDYLWKTHYDQLEIKPSSQKPVELKP